MRAPGPETPTPWHTGVVCYARFWHRAYSPRMPHFSAAGGLGARADDVRGGGRAAAAAAVSPTAKLRAAAARAPVLCSTHSYCGLQPWSAATTCVRAVARRMRARMDRSCRSTGAARCRRCSPHRHARMRTRAAEAKPLVGRWRCARPSRACSSQAMAGTHPRGRLLPHAGREGSLRKRRCRLRCLAPGGSSVWGIVSMRHRTLRAIH